MWRRAIWPQCACYRVHRPPSSDMAHGSHARSALTLDGKVASSRKLLRKTPRSTPASLTHARLARACKLAIHLVALTFPLAAPAHAQERTPGFASAFLPAGHWAIDAARRLDELGLGPPVKHG